ncbi:hypothetical protein T01_14691 [Trichinella spiralis]|uniref:Uncharacterized protein n=1 Tax=Trichinella spiralis TaxID=6334 RepID=A0A0V1BSZ1_TRISP|nr:hypothetical protein T01_14691 [Trichinella spiralis]
MQAINVFLLSSPRRDNIVEMSKSSKFRSIVYLFVYNNSFLLSQMLGSVKIRQEIKTESLPDYVVVKQYLPTKD